MKTIDELLKRTNKLLLPVFDRSWLILIATFVGCEFGHQFFTHMTQSLSQQGLGQLAQIPAMLGDMFVSLFEYTVMSMLIPQRVMELERNQPPGSFWHFTEMYVWPLTVESIRQFAVTLLWLFALVIPGIIKYIRYTFVNYVVVADHEYTKGNVDALDESERLIKGITWQMFIFLVASTGIDYWQSSLRETHSIYMTPGLALVASIFFFAVNYYINVGLFVLYQMRVEKLKKTDAGGVQNGSHIQLA